MGAWYKREAQRLLRLHRAGNMEIIRRPESRVETVFGMERERLTPAIIRIRNEEGATRDDEVRGPAFAMFEKLAAGGDNS